jgi:hypothetical protein
MGIAQPGKNLAAGGFRSDIKRQGGETDSSSPCSAMVRNARATPLFHSRLRRLCLTNEGQVQLSFTYRMILGHS